MSLFEMLTLPPSSVNVSDIIDVCAYVNWFLITGRRIKTAEKTFGRIVKFNDAKAILFIYYEKYYDGVVYLSIMFGIVRDLHFIFQTSINIRFQISLN